MFTHTNSSDTKGVRWKVVVSDGDVGLRFWNIYQHFSKSEGWVLMLYLNSRLIIQTECLWKTKTRNTKESWYI